MGFGNELRAEVEIDATPAEVWAVLMDFSSYPRWNPFVTSIRGGAAVGDRLTVRLQPPGGRGITMRPRVTESEPGRTFAWLGVLGVPHLFDGAHRFELEPIDGGRRTRFVQSERFRGLLVRAVRRAILPATLRGFEAMNRSLAARAAAGGAAA
jgi:hypothetical protein